VGRLLAARVKPRRGELALYAVVLKVSARTLRKWRDQAGDCPLMGRPPHAEETWRAAVVPVARAWKAQGRSSGRPRVQERQHVEVKARDALWSHHAQPGPPSREASGLAQHPAIGLALDPRSFNPPIAIRASWSSFPARLGPSRWTVPTRVDGRRLALLNDIHSETVLVQQGAVPLDSCSGQPASEMPFVFWTHSRAKNDAGNNARSDWINAAGSRSNNSSFLLVGP